MASPGGTPSTYNFSAPPSSQTAASTTPATAQSSPPAAETKSRLPPPIVTDFAYQQPGPSIASPAPLSPSSSKHAREVKGDVRNGEVAGLKVEKRASLAPSECAYLLSWRGVVLACEANSFPQTLHGQLSQRRNRITTSSTTSLLHAVSSADYTRSSTRTTLPRPCTRTNAKTRALHPSSPHPPHPHLPRALAPARALPPSPARSLEQTHPHNDPRSRSASARSIWPRPFPSPTAT